MASAVHPPRGMRDFLPAAKAHREEVLTTIRRVFTAHGFAEIETPVLEDVRRLHSGLGGDNEKLSFSVLRRGLEAEDLRRAADEDDPLALADLGLRFDLTVPLARFYATHHAELPGVFRSLQIAPVWRAERPQRGRFRQFVQCDIDIIGEESALAEAELIAAASSTLEALGLRGCTIRVNDRRILNSLLEHCGFPEPLHGAALVSIDKLDKIGTAGVVSELVEVAPDPAHRLEAFLRRLEDRVRARIPVTGAAMGGVLPDGVGGAAVGELDSLAQTLQPDGAVPLVFDPTLVRGMGYYTGTIFEIAHPDSGSSVGGGGRYDGMIGRFLGADVPACGFSIGFERIVDLVEAAQAQAGTSTVLVYGPGVGDAELLATKRRFIARGHRVRLARRAKNMKALLAQAAQDGYTGFAVIDEANAGQGPDAVPTRPLVD